MNKVFALICLSFCCFAAFAEVAEIIIPDQQSGLGKMKDDSGKVTVAITKGEGNKKPDVDLYIIFNAKNVLSVSVAEGYVINKVSIATIEKYGLLEPCELSSGSLTESIEGSDWIPEAGDLVSSMSVTNGSEAPEGFSNKDTKISAIKVDYGSPSADRMTPQITDDNVSLIAGGGIQISVNVFSPQYELYYKSSEQSRSDVSHEGYTPADGTGTTRTFTLSAPGKVNYYVYDPTTQTKGLERITVVKADGTTTGIVSLRPSDEADDESEGVYDLMGRRVTAINHSGIYLKHGKKYLLK